MTNDNAIAIASTTKLLQIAKKSLARYKTLLKQEEANMDALRSDENIFSNAKTQAMWLIERRMKSIQRWETDVAELEARLVRLNANK